MQPRPLQNIPIVVLNLAYSKERRTFMERQLQSFDVAYEIFPAVDGSQLLQYEKELYCDNKTQKKLYCSLTDGEIACSLSHLRLYEKIVTENIPELLILEDDVLLKSAFFHIVFQRKKWMPRGCGLFTLSNPDIAEAAKRTENLYALTATKENSLYPIDTQGTYYVQKNIRTPFGAYAYIITKKAASFLLKNLYPIRNYADCSLYNRRSKLNIYILNKGICSVLVKKFETTIPGREIKDNHLKTKHTLRISLSGWGRQLFFKTKRRLHKIYFSVIGYFLMKYTWNIETINISNKNIHHE